MPLPWNALLQRRAPCGWGATIASRPEASRLEAVVKGGITPGRRPGGTPEARRFVQKVWRTP
jgi:hypothetical protein